MTPDPEPETGPNRSCCSPSRAGALPVSKLPRRRRQPATGGMVELAGGTFLMGSEDSEGFQVDQEGPVREVVVRPFLIDTVAVTNARFAAFVKATGYVTEAENIGWSFVFYQFVDPGVLLRCRRLVQAPWWAAVPSATWRSPEGWGTDVSNRQHHPAVHVSWNDAMAYCAWAGTRLPTEAEWEYAARGGLEQRRYPWGNELMPGGIHRCNIWQGDFPHHNTGDDGFIGTAPVKAYRPNGFGLYNTAGNVWEWCGEPFHIEAASTRAIRGGSYLCHRSYCNRYRVAARTSNTLDSSAGHMGFRCAADTQRHWST